MSGFLGRLLKEKGVDLAGLSGDDRKALVDEVCAAAAARDDQNREYSRQLSKQLSGACVVTFNERPDGTGFFYATFWDGSGEHSYRADVMPPRPLWSGDFGADAADATRWIVYLDGEEVQRAETIGDLSVLVIGGA